jgi:hypothetical protein
MKRTGTKRTVSEALSNQFSAGGYNSAQGSVSRVFQRSERHTSDMRKGLAAHFFVVYN